MRPMLSEWSQLMLMGPDRARFTNASASGRATGAAKTARMPIHRAEDPFLTFFAGPFDQPFQGRNRRYYRITDSGRERYQELMEEWQLHKEAIDRILKGGSEE